MIKRIVTLALSTVLLLAVTTMLTGAQVASHRAGNDKSARRVVPVDCKDDMDCFIRAAQTCQRAKMSGTSSLFIFGVTITSRGATLIRGGSLDACKVYMRSERVEVKIDEELTQQLIANGMTRQELVQKQREATRMAHEMDGMDGTCVFKTKVYLALLKKWHGGASSTSDWKLGQCQGRMFSGNRLKLKVKP